MLGIFNLFKSKKSNSGISQQKIKTMIKESCEKKLPVSITIDNNSTTFMSTLIAFDPEEKWLIIDTLIPDAGNKYLRESESLNVICNENNSVNSFSSGYIGEVTYETYPSVKIRYPETIEVVQRRNYVRVDPSIIKPIVISFESDKLSQIEINLPVRDISEGGVSLILPVDIGKQLSKGTIFNKVSISIPDRGKIITKGIIRSLLKGSPEKQICGVELVGLTEDQMDIIYRYVVERQKEKLRKAKKIGS